MANRNYLKGRRAEYKLMQKLRKEGASYVMRTAGSHGPVDVIAIGEGLIRMYQVKQGSMPSKEDREKFAAFADMATNQGNSDTVECVMVWNGKEYMGGMEIDNE